MGNGFVWLRSRSTGKTGYYPQFFATWPDFESIDPAEDVCQDCVVQEDEPQPEDEILYDYDLESDE